MKKTLFFSLIILLSIFCVGIQAGEAIQVTGPDNADKISIHSEREGQVVVSVLDAEANPLMDLKETDFAVMTGEKKGKIISVSTLEVTKEVPMNYVLVIDNSTSMKHRNAVKPLLEGLDKFINIVRPIDNVNAVVFDSDETINLKSKDLHVRTFQSSNREELRSFFNESFTDRLTGRTYLYDSMLVGLDITRKMPADSNKYFLVLTDGEDINSKVGMSDVEEMAQGIPNFTAYAVDFKEKESKDFFLNNFAKANDGKLWKAGSEADLLEILQAFSDTLLHQYIISYRFLNPPQGTLAFDPDTITIEEVTTIDSSPLLNYVFFGAGQSDLPNQYVLFSNKSQAQDFSEERLTSSMEKYRNILNIIGKRLTDNPDASITITGCNSNSGLEKGNIELSKNRSASVQTYLQRTWGIDPSRMEVKAQNLPKAASSSTSAEGIAENQRAEIYSDNPAILDIIKSTYVQEMADLKSLRILPQIQAEAGIADWKVELRGEDETVIESAAGSGDMTSAVTFNLVPAGLSKIASFKTLTAGIEVTDKEGEAFRNATAATTSVKVIRKEEMMAEKKGYHVLEQYALILFEYDSAEIREHNKLIVDRIVARMKKLPSAEVKIVGHTDTIGAEKYNMNLSKRRAKAVYDQLVAAGMASHKNLTYTGVGPHSPLYDNADPEGRALNRTVTVTLEYDERG